MDVKSTAFHSLYTIFLSQLASLALTFIKGEVPPVPVATLAAMIHRAIAGGLLGTKLLLKLEDRRGELFFRLLLTFIFLLCLYNLARFLM
jgi:uncharacterized membrane protein YfcA